MTTQKEPSDSAEAKRFEAQKAALEERIAQLQQANEKLREETKRLERLALYDTQTGLANRDSFLRQLEHIIAIADRRNEEVALLALDLDGFKVINDRLGHAAGDEVLRQTGARLGQALRKADQKFRIGGDEFAVLLEPRAQAFDGARLVAERIAECLVAPTEIKGNPCSIGVSIGIAVFPGHGRESTELLRRADAAMYEAKKKQLVVAGASDLGATTILRSLQAELFQLIYVSTAVKAMSQDDLVGLLTRSRERNERLQLTGMLLYANGKIMEVLEGEEAGVSEAFAEIERDGRHKNLDKLRSEHIPHRNFPNWTMGFEGFDGSSVEAFTSFLVQDEMPEYFDEKSVEAHAMLLAFKNATLT